MSKAKMFTDDYDQNYDFNSYDEYGAHTGDPNLDNEYNKQHLKMPEIVKNFLVYFRNCVNEGLIFELQTLYETSWPKLTEDYFEKTPLA
jgi:translation initiation factor 3 subunit L